MKLETVLTVAQSKRLIAKGVVRHPAVLTAFRLGVIGVCRGTTCSYVAEEFLGRPVERFSYTTGLTLPPEPYPPVKPAGAVMHDMIIRRGEAHLDGETVIEASKNMRPGDIIIKGANALNYEKGVAGCLVGHPAGGTAGGFWGPLYGKKLRLVIPVGLEKQIAGDIIELSRICMEENPGNSLMPMTGIIITEIEAIAILTGASARQTAAGGVRGAEGAVRLLISGDERQMSAVRDLISSLELEPSY